MKRMDLGHSPQFPEAIQFNYYGRWVLLNEMHSVGGKECDTNMWMNIC